MPATPAMPITAPAPALRTTRSVVFAAVCMALTLAGHLAAGGAAVSGWAVGAGFAALWSVTWALCCAERSLQTILGCLMGGQFLLHAFFAGWGAAGVRSTCAPVMVMAPGGGTAGPGTMAGACAHQAAGQMPVTGHGGWAMTAAHLAVALVVAWWLRRGERAVWTLARLSARLTALLTGTVLAALWALLRPVPRIPVPAVVAHRTGWPAPARPAVWPLRHVVIGRAPPNGSTVYAL